MLEIEAKPEVFSLLWDLAKVNLLKNHNVNLEIFTRIFVFAYSIKRHTYDRKILRLGYDLPISVVDRVISGGFYFHLTSHMGSFLKIRPS